MIESIMLNILLIIILQKSELIHINLLVEKTLIFYVIFIKSVVNNKIYYYSIVLEKGLHEDKSNP